MTNKYVEPHRGDAFNCPHCEAYAHQIWYPTVFAHHPRKGNKDINNLSVAFCSRCGEYSLWLSSIMLYPNSSLAPLPIDDMPMDVKEDFLEAREIVNQSPRGATALLRLALQKLMPHLGENSKNLNTDIGQLVQKGLSVKIQKALDSLRVIGNDAVHPGTLDLKDDSKTALSLFMLLNMIVEVMIVQPKEVDLLYESLPAQKIEGIENRDKNSTTDENSS